MKFSLVVARGAKEGSPIPITKHEFVIGREPQCHMRPTSQTISKRHCALLIRGNRFFVMDMKSTNGTYVNDEQVHGERELQNGDILKIGPLEFGIRIENPVEKPRPPIAAPSAATKTGSETLGEDEIGSLLLDMAEDDQAGNDADFEGTTIMQALKPEESQQLAEAQQAQAPYRPPSKSSASSQNTSSAAKAILEKYRRRPRQ